jgi:hypothetical protein
VECRKLDASTPRCRTSRQWEWSIAIRLLNPTSPPLIASWTRSWFTKAIMHCPAASKTPGRSVLLASGSRCHNIAELFTNRVIHRWDRSINAQRIERVESSGATIAVVGAAIYRGKDPEAIALVTADIGTSDRGVQVGLPRTLGTAAPAGIARDVDLG